MQHPEGLSRRRSAFTALHLLVTPLLHDPYPPSRTLTQRFQHSFDIQPQHFFIRSFLLPSLSRLSPLYAHNMRVISLFIVVVACVASTVLAAPIVRDMSFVTVTLHLVLVNFIATGSCDGRLPNGSEPNGHRDRQQPSRCIYDRAAQGLPEQLARASPRHQQNARHPRITPLRGRFQRP